MIITLENNNLHNDDEDYKNHDAAFQPRWKLQCLLSVPDYLPTDDHSKPLDLALQKIISKKLNKEYILKSYFPGYHSKLLYLFQTIISGSTNELYKQIKNYLKIIFSRLLFNGWPSQTITSGSTTARKSCTWSSESNFKTFEGGSHSPQQGPNPLDFRPCVFIQLIWYRSVHVYAEGYFKMYIPILGLTSYKYLVRFLFLTRQISLAGWPWCSPVPWSSTNILTTSRSVNSAWRAVSFHPIPPKNPQNSNIFPKTIQIQISSTFVLS